LGEVTVQRVYYYCHRCGAGLIPWDIEVGLTSKRLTPGAERAASLAGLLTDSFEEAAEKVLPELSGLRLSETTVQRTTEAAGERMGAYLDQGKVLSGPTPWNWHKDAQGKTCAYVSVDATGGRQQASGGGPAEGRMPYVGMVYSPVPELPKGSPPAPPVTAKMRALYVAAPVFSGRVVGGDAWPMRPRRSCVWGYWHRAWWGSRHRCLWATRQPCCERYVGKL
jgi:hypothetical protein